MALLSCCLLTSVNYALNVGLLVFLVVRMIDLLIVAINYCSLGKNTMAFNKVARKKFKKNGEWSTCLGLKCLKLNYRILTQAEDELVVCFTTFNQFQGVIYINLHRYGLKLLSTVSRYAFSNFCAFEPSFVTYLCLICMSNKITVKLEFFNLLSEFAQM